AFVRSSLGAFERHEKSSPGQRGALGNGRPHAPSRPVHNRNSTYRQAPALTSFHTMAAITRPLVAKGQWRKQYRKRRQTGLASSSVVKAAPYCRRQAACRFSADAFPVLRLATTSKVTFCPSLSS